MSIKGIRFLRIQRETGEATNSWVIVKKVQALSVEVIISEL
jgi:hypothetical protein